ncbi:uncharacterized protein I303_106951 [Kwoniella dejecticola CBS 10117]|uniref:Zn(2)-C6 fungal-type domain-containing protein n=1 Tax=Kwoniella dejecticola CBS 10117 TaxID=1296121 RepID=A0A1A5ZYA9_9TREE|nr:uncharacterized protein I303_06352 [Kwoniella dejecticola CBS 10117]OBR82795.1 hypothetical protein I303_06352 [Kwoniella dejecticola CBS 10117]
MDFGIDPSSAGYSSLQVRSQPPPTNQPIASSSSSFIPTGSSSPSDSPRSGKNQRKRSGCLTCRLRKKKCDEGKPACGACLRLGLDCMGYETKRPEWMNKKEKVKDVTTQIKQTVNETKSAKMRDHWAARAASVAAKDEEGLSTFSPEGSIEYNDQAGFVSNTAISANAPSFQPSIPSMTSTEFPPTATSSRPFPSQQYSYSGGPIRNGYHTQHTTIPISATSHQPIEESIDPYVPQSAVSSPLIDPDILTLLGLVPPSRTTAQTEAYFPLCPQLPNTLWFPYPSTFTTEDGSEDMRYFHHYLTVILPLTYRFDNQPISDLVAPLALQNPRVLQAFSAIAALHIAHKKRPQAFIDGDVAQNSSIPYSNADDIFARNTIQATIRELKSIPSAELGTDDSILAALSANSFNLFDGGESKSWVETADLCRRCLAAVLSGVGGIGSTLNGSRAQIDISAVMERLGHLVSPLMWVDILMSLTQNRASQYLPIYRVFLLDRYRSQSKVSKLLKETVMGCDNTTRLALAETIGLSEWKEKAIRSGNLSHRGLVERADLVERLLEERKWREDHLFEPNDPSTVQRMAMSNVFHHGVRVLLATVVDGCHPNVPDIATAVQDTANALAALDKCDAQGATDKLMIFPIVIAGCHADRPALQRIFRHRFARLGQEGAAFGNTKSALKLMEEVWRRRAEAQTEQVEIHWRKVMFDMYEEGLLLI